MGVLTVLPSCNWEVNLIKISNGMRFYTYTHWEAITFNLGTRLNRQRLTKPCRSSMWKLEKYYWTLSNYVYCLKKRWCFAKLTLLQNYSIGFPGCLTAFTQLTDFTLTVNKCAYCFNKQIFLYPLFDGNICLPVKLMSIEVMSSTLHTHKSAYTRLSCGQVHKKQCLPQVQITK